ncbi:MAG TPA: hypothetical protein VFD42_05375 [Chloroflexota bacterium]|nr:hypothetical protein [Chloroflexota bacterium]
MNPRGNWVQGIPIHHSLGELPQALNPVIVRGDGAVVVDAKLVWKHLGS